MEINEKLKRDLEELKEISKKINDLTTEVNSNNSQFVSIGYYELLRNLGENGIGKYREEVENNDKSNLDLVYVATIQDLVRDLFGLKSEVLRRKE